MLPATERVVVEPDEASILSSLFSKPLIHSNKITRGPFANGAVGKAAPYDVTHYTSAYDADTTEDHARLLPHELMCEESPWDRFNYEYTKRNCIIKSITRKDGMPSIWLCIKNAFRATPG
jgi:hypothetical protein